MKDPMHLTDKEREDIRWLIRRSREHHQVAVSYGGIAGRDERRCERLELMLARIEDDRYITEPVKLSPEQRERNERLVIENAAKEKQLDA